MQMEREEIAKQIEKYRNKLQELTVEKKTLLNQKETVEKEINELTKECLDKYGKKPEELKNMIDELMQEMQSIMNDLNILLMETK